MNFQIIESIVIGLIVILQIIVFCLICKKIRAYKKLFSNTLGIKNNDELSVPQVVVYDGKDKVVDDTPLQGAVDSINSYIENNWGSSVNFSIIENIIERESSSRDEEIQHLIPTPLYLGLAATMVGIIMGLFSMGRISGGAEQNNPKDAAEVQVSNADTITNVAEYPKEELNNASNQNEDSLGEIDKLINGVKIAMIASLFGLLWTTLLSTWIYKKARNNVNNSKNSKLNFLQSNLLLPTEDNTLVGIRECIDQFSRNVGRSISELTTLANTNAEIARKINESTRRQEHILTEIQEFKPAKVTKVLADLFDKVDANMESYREFSNYLGLMSEISERLSGFASKTQNIEDLAQEVKNTFTESQQLFQFLSTHLRGVENIGQQSLEAINAADSHFNQAVQQLDREMNARIQTLSDGSNAFDSRITEIFTQVGERLQEITRYHVEALSNAYHNNLPEFKRLEKLDNLDGISDKLDGIANIETISQIHAEQVQSMVSPITTLKSKTEEQNRQILLAIDKLGERLEKIENNTGKLRRNNDDGGFRSWIKRLFGKKKKNRNAHKKQDEP